MSWNFIFEGARAAVRAAVVGKVPGGDVGVRAIAGVRGGGHAPNRPVRAEGAEPAAPEPPAIETVLDPSKVAVDSAKFEEARGIVLQLIDGLPPAFNGVRVHVVGHEDRIVVFEVAGKALTL